MRFVVLALVGLMATACTVREGGAPTTPSVCTEGGFTTLIGRVGPDIGPDELPVLYRQGDDPRLWLGTGDRGQQGRTEQVDEGQYSHYKTSVTSFFT